jgi:hypothetical protein
MAGLLLSVVSASADERSSLDAFIRKQAGMQESPPHWVVVFLSSRCPCSTSHEPRIREIAAKYQAQGFQFIGVNANADENAEESAAHFKASELGFPVLTDRKGEWLSRFPAMKTPHVFVVSSPSGKHLYQGGVDDSVSAVNAQRIHLTEALDDLVQGRVVRVPMARSLGCHIKR